MESIKLINYSLAILFFLCYAYQFIYVLIGLPRAKKRSSGPVPLHTFAVTICARNEAAVIGNLIESIKHQDYPSSHVDIFVVADGCTDATAKIARAAGATVWERNCPDVAGKGHALAFLLNKIRRSGRSYDGYFVFDADNVLDRSYISEMNRTFSEGYRIVTSYRNSKNYDTNWVSAGYSLWFLREARFLNAARMRIGSSCAVSGTGFLVHSAVIEKNNGWKHFLLTEDIEFTVDSILQGERIGYCSTAVFYDEQPTTFRQSWHQRLRWAKGGLQVFRKYGAELVTTLFKRRSFACYDMIMTTLPAIVLTCVALCVNTFSFVASVTIPYLNVLAVLTSAGEFVWNIYGTLFLMGFLTTLTEWKQIHCPAYKKLLYTLTFPIFMLTYIPISLVALFRKVEWKPITHSVVRTLDDIRLSSEKAS
ncbi:glycosyltransferase [Oscillospiraceae bacterium OttesenSCG-928-F05]|nr:glycosyltransferase [Oscillospiraceae bacterium OttesenSCG-928-F05]